MNAIACRALLASTLLFAAGLAGADAPVRETRAVDQRTSKIKLGGVINLKVKQGATPSLVLYGDKQYLARVRVTQEGDTLSIDTTERNWNSKDKSDVRAELTLPKLSEFRSHGVGETEVQGFSGDTLKLTLDGAGAITVASAHKHVLAKLGGVGSMTLSTTQADSVDLSMHGAGHITVNGDTKLLKANMGGVGGLDTKQLRADSVELDMNGLGGAQVFAKTSAVLKLNGLGSATVYGQPANRQATTRGLGKVSWQ